MAYNKLIDLNLLSNFLNKIKGLIPTKVSNLENDSGYITGITSSDVTTALGYTPPTQDTTYESKAASSGGTDVSLVTTGEKYNWNTRSIPASGTTGQVLKKSSNSDYATEWGDESGGGSLCVTLTYSSGRYTADKTFAEIYEAYQTGINIFAKDGNKILELTNIDSASEDAAFREINLSSSTVSSSHYYIGNSSVRKISDQMTKPTAMTLELLNDGSGEYQDSPTGPFSVYASDVGDISNIISGLANPNDTIQSVSRVQLSFGYPSQDVGSGETSSAEYYNCISGVCSYDDQSGTSVITLTFRTVSMRSGTPVVKTVTVSDEAGTWDSLENATVTYSEEPLGSEDTLPLTGGTMTGAINMGSNKITNLSTPTANSDAATKAYADSRGIPAGGSSGQVLKKSSATDYAVTWSNDSGKALHISKSSFSSLPQTISNSSITANMRVVNCVWSTPASITGDVTWTTAAGSLTLSGSISGSTKAEIDLIEF